MPLENKVQAHGIASAEEAHQSGVFPRRPCLAGLQAACYLVFAHMATLPCESECVSVRFTWSNHVSALRAPAEGRSLVEKLCTQHRLRRADVARIDIGGANGIGGVGAQALEGVNSKRSLVSSPLAGRSENGQVPITKIKSVQSLV